jgi:diguanylate cyclase (GGDEF)-like protein
MDERLLLTEATLRLEFLLALHDVGKALISSLELDEVLQTIMQKISVFLRPSHWSLVLSDPEHSDLYFEIAMGEGADRLKGVRIAYGEGIVGWVAREGRPVVVADTATDTRFCKRFDKLTNISTKSVLAVPLMVRGKVLGVIELIGQPGSPAYTDEHLRIMEPFADFAAIAISNARNFTNVQRLTITDDCTRLYNTRHLHDTLALEVQRAQRYSHPVSLIFFDMDHFKLVNDTHGHQAGSRLLFEVGELVRAGIRAIDIGVRYGGDEFAIVLPETAFEGACGVALRMWRAVGGAPYLASLGLTVRATGSFGVATFPQDAHSPDELLAAADKAMYTVKENGRDGVAAARSGIISRKAT